MIQFLLQFLNQVICLYSSTIFQKFVDAYIAPLYTQNLATNIVETNIDISGDTLNPEQLHMTG